MKVVSGSLDVLETVGRKTYDVSMKNEFFSYFLILQIWMMCWKVINEADPELKGTRRLLGKQNRPTLSEVCYLHLFVFIICLYVLLIR